MTSNSLGDLVDPELLPKDWEIKSLDMVAYVNQETTNLKNLGWIHYTDISSVGTHSVEPPAVLLVGDAPSRARRILRPGDTVISSVRPNRKSFFYFNNEWSNAVASTGFVVVSPRNIEDSMYLYAVLTSDSAVRIYEAACETGAYPAFNASRLNDLRIPWPPLSIRNNIGMTIMNLQEKIKINNEISKTLEKIAQTIFKSWFIDFDPVKAKIVGEIPTGVDVATSALFPESMDESEIGLIPRGWGVQKVDEILVRKAIKGLPKSTSLNNLGKTLVLEQGDSVVAGFTDEEADVYATSNSPMFIFGDHTCRMRLSTIPFSVFPNTIVLNSEIRNSYWAFGATHGLQKFESYRRHWMELAYKLIVVPSKELANHYGGIAEPLFIGIDSLMLQNRQISALRDELVPRLISGELQIPEDMLAS